MLGKTFHKLIKEKGKNTMSKEKEQSEIQENACKIFGTIEESVFENILRLSTSAIIGGELRPKLDVLYQGLCENKPKDSVEAQLFTQAHTLFSQGMTYLSRAENQKMICHSEHYMKFAIKLLRLHNETVESLNRYRKGGEQKIVVQHVQVANGGQAAFVTGNFEGVR